VVCAIPLQCVSLAPTACLQQEGYELMETHDGTGTIIIVDFLINNGIFVSNSSSYDVYLCMTCFEVDC
jgi:hypothetical protein